MGNRCCGIGPRPAEEPRDYYKEAGQTKLSGQDLMCARDQIQDDIFKETFWCLYLYFAGCGCMNPLSKGCCLQIGELCCLAGTCKSASCYDEDGCVAFTNKCCCALCHMEIPPSNTPGCGCGPLMCCGNLQQDRVARLSPSEKEEFELLNTTCWCCFLYCFGFGCNSPGGSDACCMTEGKLCCLWSNLSTDTACCEDGWIEFTSKCCCCVLDASFPAGKTPGIGCCNVLYGGNLYDPDSGSMASAARNVSKPKSMFG